MNGYELSRNFWDWSFEQPEKVKPIHAAIYFFSIEHCNRLGWKEKFGLPSQMVMEAIGVKNWKTYSAGLNDLVEFGFLKLIERSKNQYSSNIVAIVNFTEAPTKAPTKALDKALYGHNQKHSPKQRQSNVSIDKQETINQEQQTINEKVFNFRLSLIDLGVNEKIVEDWIKVRKTKHATNTETAFNKIKSQIEKSKKTANECITLAVEKDWKGFEAEWIKNNNTNYAQKEQPAFHVHTTKKETIADFGWEEFLKK